MMIYFGSIVNAGLIVIGTVLGLLLKKAIPERLQEILFQCCGLITLFLGFSMASEMKNMIIVVLSLMVGTIVGEYFSLEDKLETFGNKLKSRLASLTSHDQLRCFIILNLSRLSVLACI